MESMKWARYLGKSLVKDILAYDPVDVDFVPVYPKLVKCIIKVGNNGSLEVGIGYAICSSIDKFDLRIGKNKAAGRAVKALANKRDDEPIRDITEVPNSWTMKQVRNLLDLKSIIPRYKSVYN